MEQSATLEESIEEDELQLWLIGILSRDSFLMMQYLEQHFLSVHSNVKELMPLSEDIHVTTQGYMQHHENGDMNAQEDIHRGENLRG